MRGKDVGSSGIGVKNWLFGNEVSGVSIQTYDSGIRKLPIESDGKNKTK